MSVELVISALNKQLFLSDYILYDRTKKISDTQKNRNIITLHFRAVEAIMKMTKLRMTAIFAQ